jgi:hypothetical protein
MYDDALKSFGKALKAKKDYADAIEWTAYTYEKKNMLVQALTAWNELGKVKDLPDEKKQLAEEHAKIILNAVKY